LYLQKAERGGVVGSGSPDWIAQVEIWDGSSWVNLRVGIKEAIKKKIVWNSIERGQILDERTLSRFAVQCKSAYLKKYKIEPYWYLEPKDIIIKSLCRPKDKVQKTIKENPSYEIVEDDFGQFYFVLSPGVVA